jgi:hypothetical protein
MNKPPSNKPLRRASVIFRFGNKPLGTLWKMETKMGANLFNGCTNDFEKLMEA